MRSLTRDPGLADPAAVPPWTIFLQTLIHDFDALLWLNPGAEPVEVYATADALVAPDFKDAGLLDTAVVVITFDNGARAVAEASFSAAYGYDVRGEVFGSGGMVTVGDGARSSAGPAHAARPAPATPPAATSSCCARPTRRELVEFVAAVREGRRAVGDGDDARRALGAGAGLHRVGPARHARVAVTPGGRAMSGAVHPRRVRRDGLHRPALPRAGAPHPRARLPGRDLGLDQPRTSTPSPRPGRRSRR